MHVSLLQLLHLKQAWLISIIENDRVALPTTDYNPQQVTCEGASTAHQFVDVFEDLMEFLPELVLTLLMFAGNLPRHFNGLTPAGYFASRYKSAQVIRDCLFEEAKEQHKARDARPRGATDGLALELYRIRLEQQRNATDAELRLAMLNVLDPIADKRLVCFLHGQVRTSGLRSPTRRAT